MGENEPDRSDVKASLVLRRFFFYLYWLSPCFEKQNQQNEVQKAVSVLIKSVRNKFAAKKESQGCEVQSLAAVSAEDQAGDPVALYRRLLSLPLPYDYKCPPLLPGVDPQSLGSEKVFLWLSYW